MRKILILTVHSMNPTHPRIGKEITILEENGYVVECLSLKDMVTNSVTSNRFFRGLFQNPFFKTKVLKKLENYLEYDCFLFYDLHLLNVATAFKKEYPLKKVIYETIDDNLSLYLYYNFKKLPNFLGFESKVLKYLRKFELQKAFELDAIIVNSKGLEKIFQKKAILLYYTSIFEGIVLEQGISNPNALLYLGGFDEGKGALETIALSEKYNIPLFIFGNSSEKIKTIISKYEQIQYFGYMNAEEIMQKLTYLTQKYFLFGVSLINPLHNSYTIQIANKEIDYISLGIPILGNGREPTKELIAAGCGIFYGEFKNQIGMSQKKELNSNCLVYAKENFSKQNYRKKLLEVFNAL